jgi:protein-tyrosine phosphatase
VLPDRIIAVPGTSNFRDFGGCATGSGGAMISGRLFRSAHLGGVGAAGASRLAELGIATIIDLRGSAERMTAPAAFADPHGIRVVSTPIEPAASARIHALVAERRAGAAEIRDVMIETYRRFATTAAPEFGRALVALADACEAPFVVHCTAGKDRTGFLVAIVQALLGVPRDAIFSGYEATNRAWDRLPAAIPLPLDPAAREALLSADPAYLETAFAAIATRHGSVADYVAAALGGDHGAVDRLAERLLDLGDATTVRRETPALTRTPMPR